MPDPLHAWLGRHERTTDVVTAAPYAALCATLDHEAATPPAGTLLPPLWHWLYFLPRTRRSDLGPDGHARRGGFLPPVPLPRRMWAGGELAFLHPIAIGDRVVRTSTIAAIDEKTGRSGPLVFVKVRHEIRREGDDDVAIREVHDIVYREAPRALDAVAAPRPAPAAAAWQRQWVPDDVLLFRYSALTFNGHRIHYDRRYAIEVEGYPGLVVHGPLIATLLLELVRERLPEARVTHYAFRAVRPLFDSHAFDACGAREADNVALWAQDHEGTLAMEASATLA